MTRAGIGGPNTGRWVVLVAGGVGISAVVGYGVLHNRDRADVATALDERRSGEAAPATDSATAKLDLLLSRARDARTALDVVALVELGEALERAVEGARAPARRRVELELAEVLATRALEASIRAHAVEAGRADAERVATTTIETVAPMLDALEAVGADPGRVRAARARVALAAGGDVLEDYPGLMLPTFRDEELRLAALAGPLWRDADVPPDLVGEVVEALRGAEQDSGMVQALLAIALKAHGDEQSALAVVDAMLRRVPSQPTARALRTELVRETTEGPPLAASPEPAVTVAAVSPVDPEPEPEPKVEPEPEPEPKVEPEPEPKVESAPKPKPEPTRPSASSTSTNTSATRAGNYEALVTDGCKKVQSGDAAAGFELLTRAFDIKPGAVKVIVCMAEAHHKLGRAASARALAERALAKAPSNIRALSLMAALENERGNRAGAEKYYRKILDVDPDHGKAKAFLGG